MRLRRPEPGQSYPESARPFGVYVRSYLARRGLRYEQDSPRHRKALDIGQSRLKP